MLTILYLFGPIGWLYACLGVAFLTIYAGELLWNVILRRNG